MKCIKKNVSTKSYEKYDKNISTGVKNNYFDH